MFWDSTFGYLLDMSTQSQLLVSDAFYDRLSNFHNFTCLIAVVGLDSGICAENRLPCPFMPLKMTITDIVEMLNRGFEDQPQPICLEWCTSTVSNHESQYSI